MGDLGLNPYYISLFTDNQNIITDDTYVFDCKSCCDMYCHYSRENTGGIYSIKAGVGSGMLFGFKHGVTLCHHIFQG